MKRNIRFIMAMLCVLVFLASCGKAPENTADQVGTESAAPVSSVPVSTPESSKADQALDKAFAAGKAVFAETAVPLPNPETCEIVMPPDSFWETYGYDNPGEEALRSALADGELKISSYAPDGSRAAGYLGNYPVIVSEGKVLLIHPEETRGVEDRYYTLKLFTRTLYGSEYARPNGKTYKVRGTFCASPKGMIWSPDSRYLAMVYVSGSSSIQRPDFKYPVLTDTRTGGFFCIDSFSQNLKDPETFGEWNDGCFSGDGLYFYALGREAESNRYKFLRYDLATFEKTVIAATDEGQTAYPLSQSLTAGPDGSVNLVTYLAESGSDPVQHYALLHAGADGVLSAQPLLMGQPIAYLIPRDIAASARSGDALILYISTDSGYLDGSRYVLPFSQALVHARMGEPGDEANTAWLIRSDSLAVEAVPSAGLKDLHMSVDSDEYRALRSRYMSLRCVAMSPDGKYAAVLADYPDSKNEAVLLLIRLEDMKTLPVESELLKEAGDYVRRYGNQLSVKWTDEGLLVDQLGLVFHLQ